MNKDQKKGAYDRRLRRRLRQLRQETAATQSAAAPREWGKCDPAIKANNCQGCTVGPDDPNPNCTIIEERLAQPRRQNSLAAAAVKIAQGG